MTDLFQWLGLVFAFALGFAVGAITKSHPLRAFAWLAIPVAPGVLIVLQGGAYAFSLGLIIFVWVAFVLAGAGILLGARLHRRIAPLFRRSSKEQSESYHGPRCVACGEPITADTSSCSKCGWAQPA